MAFSAKSVMKLMKTLNDRSGKTLFCSAVIAAAGSSERMAGEDKLFTVLCGVPVLAHSLIAFEKCSLISEIIVVTRDSSIEKVSELCRAFGISKAAKIMVGGQSRAESVLCGTLAVSKKSQLIAIHDGARPCVDDEIITNAVTAATMIHAVAPAVQVSSTVKRASSGIVKETIDRNDLYETQTPQVFAAELIKAALTNVARKSIDITDDCMAAEIIGFPVHLIKGSGSNIKITTPEDYFLAEAILSKSKVESRI